MLSTLFPRVYVDVHVDVCFSLSLSLSVFLCVCVCVFLYVVATIASSFACTLITFLSLVTDASSASHCICLLHSACLSFFSFSPYPQLNLRPRLITSFHPACNGNSRSLQLYLQLSKRILCVCLCTQYWMDTPCTLRILLTNESLSMDSSRVYTFFTRSECKCVFVSLSFFLSVTFLCLFFCHFFSPLLFYSSWLHFTYFLDKGSIDGDWSSNKANKREVMSKWSVHAKLQEIELLKNIKWNIVHTYPWDSLEDSMVPMQIHINSGIFNPLWWRKKMRRRKYKRISKSMSMDRKRQVVRRSE